MPYQRLTPHVRRRNVIFGVKRIVRGHDSERGAAEAAGVSRWLLKKELNRKKEGLPIRAENKIRQGRHATLTEEAEEAIVMMAAEVSEMFGSLAISEVLAIANEVARDLDLMDRFPTGNVGRTCVDGLLGRNPEIKAALDERKVDKNASRAAFLNKLRNELKLTAEDKDKILILETLSFRLRQVPLPPGRRCTTDFITKLEKISRGERFTLCVTYTAAGVGMRPMIIFPKDVPLQEFLDDGPNRLLATATEDGGFTRDAFSYWIDNVLLDEQPVEGTQKALIFEGEKSQRSLAAASVLKNYSVAPVCCGPGNVGILPLAAVFEDEIFKILKENMKEVGDRTGNLDAEAVPALVSIVMEKIFTEANLRFAFDASKLLLSPETDTAPPVDSESESGESAEDQDSSIPSNTSEGEPDCIFTDSENENDGDHSSMDVGDEQDATDTESGNYIFGWDQWELKTENEISDDISLDESGQPFNDDEQELSDEGAPDSMAEIQDQVLNALEEADLAAGQPGGIDRTEELDVPLPSTSSSSKSATSTTNTKDTEEYRSIGFGLWPEADQPSPGFQVTPEELDVRAAPRPCSKKPTTKKPMLLNTPEVLAKLPAPRKPSQNKGGKKNQTLKGRKK